MDFPTEFRAELSQAFSSLYFLGPHALIHSVIEGRPLDHYFSQAAYQEASQLYFGADTPQKDLDHCQHLISLSRARGRVIRRQTQRDRS
jgi:hypothetical protein